MDVNCLDEALNRAVAEHIASKWNAIGVYIVEGDEKLEEDSARLFVGSGQSRILEGAIQDRIDVAQNGETDADELVFRIDAKLGRLAHSDLAAQRKSMIRTGGPMSRRDFFSGWRHAYRMISGFPVVFREKCEAEYGCVKCVNSCPVQAVAIGGGVVTVDEKRCTECGLCAASCPTAAIQMPWFSEEALMGLLDGIDANESTKKSLVLTCSKGSVPPEAWMDVEEVRNVGAVGRQQLAIAAASSLGAVMVYCPDGMCRVSEDAMRAAESISTAFRGRRSDGSGIGKAVFFLEGGEAKEKIAEVHRAARSTRPMIVREGGDLMDYAKAMNALAPKGAPVSGLGFIEAAVRETCTLCGECVKSCPHGAFGISRGELTFNPASCTGCGRCVGVCPEKSIDLRQAGKSVTFPLEPRTVYRDKVIACLRCGRPVGSEKFLSHVAKASSLDLDELSYCPNCRQKMAFEGALRRASTGAVKPPH